MSGVGVVTVPEQPGGDRPWWGESARDAVDGADLRHSDGSWLRAAGAAEGLAALVGPVRAELALAHQGIAAGAGELDALVELAAVRASWERRIEAARAECAGLAGKLRAVAVHQAEVNETVKAGFDRVEPPAFVGGRP
ncbi:hypothetical protein ACIP6P_26285 [Streptomyces sp. NPDC088729]|uniref:hypothetical protein n=1 Tax=Streptomyces sp. NPDC088729 TaxID=3365876 RepID=UPI003829D6C6